MGNFIERISDLQTDSSNALITTLQTNSGSSVSTNNPLPTVVQFLDTDGTVKQLKFNAEAPQVCSQDYLLTMAEGDISGHTPWSKIGRAYSVANTEVDLTPFVKTGTTTYVFPTSNMSLRLSSTSVQDETTGVGVRSVRIYYLDTGYVSHTLDQNLRGTTVVTTSASDIFRINNMRATSVGTNCQAQGNISLKNSNGLIYAFITTGYTRQRQIIYTVPTNQTLYVTSVKVSSISGAKVAATIFTTRANYDNLSQEMLTPGCFFMPYTEIGIQDGAFTIPLEIPTRLGQTTDIKVSALSDQDNAVLSCSLRGWLE